jgi:hypothetical protein
VDQTKQLPFNARYPRAAFFLPGLFDFWLSIKDGSMSVGGLGKSGNVVRQVTDRTSSAALAGYRLVVRRRALLAGGAAGIKAMRVAIDLHLGDAEPAESKLFFGWRSQFQFWRVIAISAVAYASRVLLRFERSQCLCCG